MNSQIWIYLICIGALIFSAHLFASFFRKSRIPDVLFLVGIGILIGPVFGFVKPDMLGSFGLLFASVTLVFILIDSGIDMHVDDLKKYWAGMVQVMFFSFILSMTVTALTVRFLVGIDWLPSFLLGSMVAGTGASIVIPMIRQMKVSDRTRTILTLESAISAVLCIVVALVLIEGFKMGQIRFERIIGNVMASFFMASLLGCLGGIVWSYLLVRVRRLQNSLFLTPAFVFVIYGVTEALGFSGAISALAFGIVLGNAKHFDFQFMHKLFNKRRLTIQSLRENEKSFFKEMVFILKTFFFVYIGISIPFTDLTALMYGAIIATAIFVVRLILVTIVGQRNTSIDRWIVSIMMPKGLVSAVLASMPRQLNIAAGYELIPHAEKIECIVYSVIFFSIVLCSLLVLLSRRRIIDRQFSPEEMVEIYDYE